MSDVAQVNRPTHDMRRRLLAGEGLTSKGCAAEYGCSDALLLAVIKALRDEGMTVDAFRPNGKTTPALFTVVGATRNEAEWGKGADVQKMAGRGHGTGRRKGESADDRRRRLDRERKAAKRQASPMDAPQESKALTKRPKRNGHVVPTLPSLGANLSICLLAVAEDGRISIGLRGDEGTWLTSVDGFSAADTNGHA